MFFNKYSCFLLFFNAGIDESCVKTGRRREGTVVFFGWYFEKTLFSSLLWIYVCLIFWDFQGFRFIVHMLNQISQLIYWIADPNPNPSSLSLQLFMVSSHHGTILKLKHRAPNAFWKFLPYQPLGMYAFIL